MSSVWENLGVVVTMAHPNSRGSLHFEIKCRTQFRWDPKPQNPSQDCHPTPDSQTWWALETQLRGERERGRERWNPTTTHVNGCRNWNPTRAIGNPNHITTLTQILKGEKMKKEINGTSRSQLNKPGCLPSSPLRVRLGSEIWESPSDSLLWFHLFSLSLQVKKQKGRF